MGIRATVCGHKRPFTGIRATVYDDLRLDSDHTLSFRGRTRKIKILPPGWCPDGKIDGSRALESNDEI